MNSPMKELYNQLLKDPRWESKRLSILLRDHYQCRNCGSNRKLQIHHRQYHINKRGHKVNPWAYNNKYLITLCDTCHKRGHELYKVPVLTLDQ